jgi:electron transfer flavoprotein alpha subunit
VNVLVFIEVRDGRVRKSSLESMSEGRRVAAKLGGTAAAVIVGERVQTLASQVGAFGAQTVYAAENAAWKLYAPEAYAASVVEAAKKSGAGAIFVAATAMGKDLAPTVAAMLDVGVAADCTGLEIQDGRILARRPVYAGRAYATVRLAKSPAVCSLRPNLFAAEEVGGMPKVEALALQGESKSAVKELAVAAQGKAELTEAGIIVSGGRGLKGPENFHLRDRLAEVLGAATGASRAVVDLGWRPHAEQVGQTGKTVSPNLYVAIGISGAIQHLAGMRTSKVIVAINKDPDAPIFKIATYGIVGDAFEVVPALTEQLRKALAQ